MQTFFFSGLFSGHHKSPLCSVCFLLLSISFRSVKALLLYTPGLDMVLPRRFRVVALVLLVAFPVCTLSRHVLLDQVSKTTDF